MHHMYIMKQIVKIIVRGEAARAEVSDEDPVVDAIADLEARPVNVTPGCKCDAHTLGVPEMRIAPDMSTRKGVRKVIDWAINQAFRLRGVCKTMSDPSKIFKERRVYFWIL